MLFSSGCACAGGLCGALDPAWTAPQSLEAGPPAEQLGHGGADGEFRGAAALQPRRGWLGRAGTRGVHCLLKN